MAYTNAWNVTSPPGTELARNIDDHIRRLRLDIDERMRDLVKDWDADPVELEFEQLNKKLLISAHAFTHNSSNDDFVGTDRDGLGVNGRVYAPIKLAPGCVLQSVELLMRVNSGLGATSITWYVRRRPFIPDAAVVTLGSAVQAINNAQEITLVDALDHEILATNMYWIFVDGPALTRIIYGARISYDSPTMRTVT